MRVACWRLGAVAAGLTWTANLGRVLAHAGARQDAGPRTAGTGDARRAARCCAVLRLVWAPRSAELWALLALRPGAGTRTHSDPRRPSPGAAAGPRPRAAPHGDSCRLVQWSRPQSTVCASGRPAPSQHSRGGGTPTRRQFPYLPRAQHRWGRYLRAQMLLSSTYESRRQSV